MIVYIMFGGLSLFVLFLFFYILKLERVFEEKLGGLELSLEEVNKELYELKKSHKNVLDATKELEKIVEEMVDDLKIVDERSKESILLIEEKIAEVYSELKKNQIPEFSNVSKEDESRIIKLYKEGYSIEEIAKELRIPAGEIEFTLKFPGISSNKP